MILPRTKDKNIAQKYSLEQVVYGLDYKKVVKLTYWDKKNKERILPPSCWPDTISYNDICPDWLYPEQKQAVEGWKWQRWYIICSWTWSGKTRMMIWLAMRSKIPCIFIMPSLEICKNLINTIDTLCTLIQWSIKDIPDWHLVMHQKTFKINASKLQWKYNIIIDELHHSSKDLRDILIQWQWAILWVTATPSRDEFEKNWFELFFWTIHNTWLESLPVKVTCIKRKVSYDIPPDAQSIDFRFYTQLIKNDQEYKKETLALIHHVYHKHKRVIVFYESIDEVNQAEQEIKCKNLFVVTWDNRTVQNTSQHIKDEKLDSFIIIWTKQCLSEWFDVPNLMVWIVTFHMGTDRVFYQMAWRVCRRHEWKTHWYLIYTSQKITLKPLKSYKTTNSKVHIRAQERKYDHSYFEGAQLMQVLESKKEKSEHQDI